MIAKWLSRTQRLKEHWKECEGGPAHFRVYTADGKECGVEDVVQAMRAADVVCVGETHDDPVAQRSKAVCGRSGAWWKGRTVGVARIISAISMSDSLSRTLIGILGAL